MTASFTFRSNFIEITILGPFKLVLSLLLFNNKKLLHVCVRIFLSGMSSQYFGEIGTSPSSLIITIMKSVLKPSDREELIRRIANLHKNSQPNLDKMKIGQMLKHCVLCEEFYLGNMQVKSSFLGRIIGKQALKAILKDESPLKRNAPTNSIFKISESTGNVEANAR